MLKEPWKPFKQANHWAILGARDPSSNEPSGESLEMAPRKQAGGTAKLHGSAWRAAADRAGSALVPGYHRAILGALEDLGSGSWPSVSHGAPRLSTNGLERIDSLNQLPRTFFFLPKPQNSHSFS